MPRAVVITGPSGVGKGTLIRSLRERMPDLSCRSRRRRAARARARRRTSTTTSCPTDEFERHVAAGDFVEHADYAGARYGTLRSELETRTASGMPVVLEIEVQGARQVREHMPEAVQVFIAPPTLEALRARLVGRGTDAPEQVDARLRTAEQELAAQDEFAHVVVNDRLEDAVAELIEIVRADDGRPVAASPLLATLEGMISPRIDRLLENVDSNYASVVVAAKRARQINSYYHNLGEGTFDEFPPPMVDTGSKNYLTIALEEVAAGKIKYQYR